MDYENVVLVKNDVMVYRIPPRQSNRGYRADDWKLDSPQWTGRLRIIAKGKELVIHLEDGKTGAAYAKCPVDAFPGIAVEPVLDSSRYFVIRLMADDGRTMFIGLGFAERTDSFDFNVAIQDHFKWIKQDEDVKLAEERLKSQPSLDLGFKEGQRIVLNLNTRRTGDDARDDSVTFKPRVTPRADATPIGLIPPPPAPPVSRSRGNKLNSSLTNTSLQTNPDGCVVHPNTRNDAISGNDSGSNLDLLADIFGLKHPTDCASRHEQASASWADFR
ncbi:unnamed protein product [Dicrocoelium dendriticum]|nr:unnamed protein product [Dicrocoelium dendriticum]